MVTRLLDIRRNEQDGKSTVKQIEEIAREHAALVAVAEALQRAASRFGTIARCDADKFCGLEVGTIAKAAADAETALANLAAVREGKAVQP